MAKPLVVADLMKDLKQGDRERARQFAKPPANPPLPSQIETDWAGIQQSLATPTPQQASLSPQWISSTFTNNTGTSLRYR